jgi:hypothetical protein
MSTKKESGTVSTVPVLFKTSRYGYDRTFCVFELAQLPKYS